MRALYAAASGMSAQQTRLDTIADNIANVGTIAYKKSRASFEDLFYQELTYGGKAEEAARLDVGAGVRLSGLDKDHSAGALKSTDAPLDVALQGSGYFVLETVDGDPVYTRDGNFTLDPDGVLVSRSGLKVRGDIAIPQDAVQVEIAQDGTIAALLDGDADFTILGQLEVIDFVNPAGLAPLGGNLYRETPASGLGEPVDFGAGRQILQGFLETSNVDVADELIQMIQAQRAYELNSKVVQAADETLQLAANLRR